MIPSDPGMTLAKAFEVEPRLPEIYEQDEEVKELVEEGIPVAPIPGVPDKLKN